MGILLDDEDQLQAARPTMRVRPEANGRSANALASETDPHPPTSSPAAGRKTSSELTADQIAGAILTDAFEVAFQPIVELGCGGVVAFEALCRFQAGAHNPQHWFARAHELGLGLQLESAVITKALAALRGMPSGVSLSLNLSPEMIASGRFMDLIAGQPHERIIAELTEHHAIADVDALTRQADFLQLSGVRTAVDDFGTGYSGLQQVLLLRPDLLKLDRTLVSGIGGNSAQQSLVSAVLQFAEETGAAVIAEGIEDMADLNTLRSIGVHMGQGWLTGRPTDLQTTLANLSVLTHSDLL